MVFIVAADGRRAATTRPSAGANLQLRILRTDVSRPR